MVATTLETFIREGKLKEEPVALEQIELLLREAVFDLDEARKTQEIAAHRATFFLAYMAMLRAGRALLLLNGYSPVRCNQHQTIVESTGYLMGNSCTHIIEHFERTRQKQHELVDQHNDLLTELEAHDAFHYAMLLVREIVKKVRTRDTQFHVAM